MRKILGQRIVAFAAVVDLLDGGESFASPNLSFADFAAGEFWYNTPHWKLNVSRF